MTMLTYVSHIRHSSLYVLLAIILSDIVKNAKYEAYLSVYVYALHLLLRTYLIELIVVRFYSISDLLINRVVV